MQKGARLICETDCWREYSVLEVIPTATGEKYHIIETYGISGRDDYVIFSNFDSEGKAIYRGLMLRYKEI